MLKRKKDLYDKQIQEQNDKIERERIQREALARIEKEHRDEARRLKQERDWKIRKRAEKLEREFEQRSREEDERRLMRAEEQRVVLIKWHMRAEKQAAESRRLALEKANSKASVPTKRPPVPKLIDLLAKPDEVIIRIYIYKYLYICMYIYNIT